MVLCVRTKRPTYEKPWPCAVILGWLFREAFKPHGLFSQDVYAFLLLFISILDGWLERGTHLFARLAHSTSRSGRLPIHTLDRYWSGSLRAYQPREILTRWNLRLFILSHTHKNEQYLIGQQFFSTICQKASPDPILQHSIHKTSSARCVRAPRNLR